MSHRTQIKLGVFGGSGRMGQALRQVAADQNFAPYWASYQKVLPEGYEYKNSYPILPLEESEALWLREIDVFVDFSSFEVLEENVKLVETLKRPYVCGVTGLSPKHFEILRNLSQKVPVIWSANFSLGIALLRSLLPKLAGVKERFDVGVLEAHHRRKKDSPSGTAKVLADDLEKMGFSVQTQVFRGGGVVGEHEILLMGEFEVLRLQHQAFDRRVFAHGALVCAHWLIGKVAGFYEFTDCLVYNH